MNTSSTPDLLAAALEFAKGGTAVFPCHPATKRPLTAHGFQDANTDPVAIIAWWQRWPNAMIGMPTGAVSGIWVLDVDDPEVFEAAAAVLGLILPITRKVITGNV